MAIMSHVLLIRSKGRKLRSFSILNIRLCQHLLLKKVSFKTKIINSLLEWSLKHQSSPSTMLVNHMDSTGPSSKSTFTYAPSMSQSNSCHKRFITKAHNYQDEGEVISNLGKILRKSIDRSIFCANCANLKITECFVWTGHCHHGWNTEASFQNRFSSIGTSCSEKWLSSHPWRSLKVHVALQHMV